MKRIEECVGESIQKFGDKVLFVDQVTGEEVSFSAFGRMLAQVAALLGREGVREGDVVTLISENSVDLAVLLYGIILHGAIAKPLNPKLTPTEILNLLEHSGSRLILSDRDVPLDGFTGRLINTSSYRDYMPGDTDRVLAKNINDAAGALLVYTSGTTGQPKGILLNRRNITTNVLTAIEWFSLDSRHSKLCILPLFHTFGFISDLSTMIFCGGKVAILPTFDLSRLKLIEAALLEQKVNSFSAVPLIFNTMNSLNLKINQGSMRFCISGAAPLSDKVATAFYESYGVRIIPAYGLTETTCFCTISPVDKIIKGSIGVPANIKIKVVSDDETVLGPRQVGELIVQGESVIEGGYFRSSVECYSSVHTGWFKTGDLGYFDEEGYFFITGRKKNMAIRGGEKVYLEDIDRCLGDLDGVIDSATVRVEDKMIEKIACFVVLDKDSGLVADDIMRFIKDRVGKSKCPDAIVFHDSIPRTATNKIKIGELQHRAKEYV
ncbi:MAG TPA: AMP-binding protein [Blastocatellia bacterium]